MMAVDPNLLEDVQVMAANVFPVQVLPPRRSCCVCAYYREGVRSKAQFEGSPDRASISPFSPLSQSMTTGKTVGPKASWSGYCDEPIL